MILNFENWSLILGGGQRRPLTAPQLLSLCSERGDETAAQHHHTGTMTSASSLVFVDLHTPPQSGSPFIVGKHIPTDDTPHTRATFKPSICFGADALVPFGARRRIQLLPAIIVVPSGVPVVVRRRATLARRLLAEVDEKLLVTLLFGRERFCWREL